MTQRRTQAERTELSDQKMLEAATQLILEVGAARTTLKDIGERAGYSRGLASSRFGSKEGLFLKMIDLHHQQLVGYMLELTEGKSGIEALLARMEALGEVFLKHPDSVRVMYTLWYESVSEESALRGQLEEYNRAGRDAVYKMIKAGMEAGDISEDMDAHSFATAYMANLFGLVYQWLVSPADVDLRHSIETLKNYCVFLVSTE
jgi:AcrR family transcriptional regulator